MAYKFQSGEAILSGNLKQEGTISGSGDLQLGVGKDVNIAGTNVLNLTTLGSSVLASSLTSVGTLAGVTSSQPVVASAGVKAAGNISGSSTLQIAGAANFNGNVVAKGKISNDNIDLSAAGVISGSGDLQLGVGSDVNIAGSNVLNLTTLGSTVVASSLTSVGTLVGVTSSRPIVAQQGLRVSGGVISGSTGISGSSAKFSGIVNAGRFVGSGAGLTNITADQTDVTSSTADAAYELVFTEYLGSDVGLGGNAGLSFNPRGLVSQYSASLVVSGTNSGFQQSRMIFGDKDYLQIKAYRDGSDDVAGLFAGVGIDISSSVDGGIMLRGGDAAGVIAQGGGSFMVQDSSESTVFSVAGATGIVSASGDLRLGAGAGIDIGGQANVLNQTTLGSTVLASSLTSVGTLAGVTSSQPVVASAGVKAAGNISGSSTLQIAGAASFNGNINAKGKIANDNIDLSAAGVISGSGDLTLGVGSDVNIAGSNVLNLTTLGSTVVASSLTSVGTLTGVTSSRPIVAQQGLRVSGGVISGSTGISGSSAKFSGIVNAGRFVGSGAGLTGISADALDVTASAANAAYELAFTEYLGTDVSLGGNAGLTFRPKNIAAGLTASLVVSGTHGGFQSSSFALGNVYREYIEYSTEDSAYITTLKALQGAIDISASAGGVVVYGGTGAQEGIDLLGRSIRIGADDDSDPLITLGGLSGVISGSGDLTLGVGSDVNIAGSNVLNLTTLGSTVVGSSLTSVGTLSSLTMGGTVNMSSNAITNVGGMTSSLGVKVGGYGLMANNLTRSAGDLVIALHDASANNVGVRTAGGAFPLKVLSTGVTELNAGNVKVGSSTGAISGSGVLQIAGAASFNSSITAKGALDVDGAITLAGATDTAVSNADDSIYFRDADGTMHRDSIVDFVSNMAGTGLSAASGQLSLSSVGTVTGVGDANATLTEGLSYGTTTLSANRTWTLPASSGLAAGDVIRIKAPADVDVYHIKVTGSGAQTIDAGNPLLYLESDASAIALHYVATNKFVIF